jgi:molybdenum cofactor cytidylyltransferase
MGSPKALLTDPSGELFVARIVTTMRSAGIDDCVIVTGRHHDQIVQAIESARLRPQPQIVRNDDPSRGQLSSLWTGLNACPPGTDAIAVTLVDVPFVNAETVRAVIDAWTRTGAPIVRASCDSRRGHPVIFDRALFDELRQAPLDVGARAVLSAHYDAIVNVPVDDRGCLVDIDTPAEYSEALKTGFPPSRSALRRAGGIRDSGFDPDSKSGQDS